MTVGCAPLNHRPEMPAEPLADARPTVDPSISLPGKSWRIKGQEVVLQAMSLLKTRYKFGGKSPESGLDCSGLVTHVYSAALGMQVEGNSASLAKRGRRIETDELKEGDLLFFNTRGAPRSHVGIYIGDNQFIHALNSRTGVVLGSLTESYYAQRFEEARTLLR